MPKIWLNTPLGPFSTTLRMANRCSRWAMVVLCVLGFSGVFAQGNRKKLEERRNVLNQQIKVTGQLLGEARNNRKAALDELFVLEAQMGQRQELIEVLDAEARLLEHTIANHGAAVLALEQDVEKARGDCAKLVRAVWRQRSRLGPWLRLFNAPSLRDLLLRWRILHRFFEFRARQFAFLKNTRVTLAEKVGELNLRRQEHLERLAELESQRGSLAEDMKEKNNLVKKLKREEGRLAKEVKELEANQEKVSALIEEAIRAEVAKAKERARKAAENTEKTEKQKTEKGRAKKVKQAARDPKPRNPEPDDDLPLSPGEARLSSSFRGNRGKLPWPVDKGVITKKFEADLNPDLPQVSHKNTGTTIQTTAGASVYCLFEGTVVYTSVMPGAQNVVIIQHGNYFTTYSNLGSVGISVGQTVGTHAPIGTAYTNGNGITEIQLEVWNGKTRENPELWLQKR